LKKEAKTFTRLSRTNRRQPHKSFLVLFFKKEPFRSWSTEKPNVRSSLALTIACALSLSAAHAQTPLNFTVLQGLAPFTTLLNTPQGRAALDANLKITYAIQTGTSKQPTLLPFPQEQLQALRDAFITGWNAAELADGLGTSLAPVYQAKARYTTWKDYTSATPSVANLIAYTNETTGSDSNAAKFFLANSTTNGATPVSAAAADILKQAGGVTDVFGKAYRRPAGSPGADPYGNSRPFQTEPSVTAIVGPDYFDQPSNNTEHLSGPAQNLTKNPSFPSGHTTYGYAESLVLGLLVPQRYAEQVVRGAEYGDNRIILGAHYAMDVIAGRTIALHDLAHLLANDPRYVGQPKTHAPTIADYQAALKTARADLTALLESGCFHPVAVCATNDTGRFSNPKTNEAFYNATQTYGLPTVYPATANTVEDIAKLEPEAGYLLTAAFPGLALEAADKILTETEGPGGGFLDNGSQFGVYSRINLYAAIRKVQGK
jgi:hypothetical protein